MLKSVKKTSYKFKKIVIGNYIKLLSNEIDIEEKKEKDFIEQIEYIVDVKKSDLDRKYLLDKIDTSLIIGMKTNSYKAHKYIKI